MRSFGRSYSRPWRGLQRPQDGFNGYVAGFQAPDTGSMRFNDYVDAVNRHIKSKQER